MINQLVLHLGDTKTGSTSIQNALVQKAYDIPGKTILYPTGSNHVAMAKTLTQQRRFGQRKPRLTRLNDVFLNSKADYGIVSAEHFQSVDPVVLNEAINTYWPKLKDRIRLVAYVRPHGDKVLSTFAERVKLGAMAPSLDVFFDKIETDFAFNYSSRFGKWREVFGARFQLRPFVRSHMHQGDVIQDFFRTILDGAPFEITHEIASNTSLRVGQLALLREAHSMINAKIADKSAPKFREARGAFGRQVGEYMRQETLGQETEKLALHAALVERIKARYAKDAATLDAAFFDGTPMSDALEQLHKKQIATAQSLNAADYFSPEVLQSTRLLANVLGDVILGAPKDMQSAIGSARSVKHKLIAEKTAG